MTRRGFDRVAGISLCLAIVGFMGCASTGDVDALDKRVAALESRANATDQSIGELKGAVARTDKTAQQALQSAQAAEASAAASAASADEAARRADAMFKKSVSK